MTTVNSHAVSGVLHALFLLLAFMTPTSVVLDAPPDWMIDEPTARFEARDVVIETGFYAPRTIADLLETGRGGAPGDGQGETEGGVVAGLKSRSEPLNPERKIKARPDEITDDVSGILHGFADQTLGADTEIALGEVDGGGGGNAFGGLGIQGAGPGGSCGTLLQNVVGGEPVPKDCEGIGLADIGTSGRGGGASCFGSWTYDDVGERVLTMGECPDARLAYGAGFGRGFGIREEGREIAIPTVVTSEPMGCSSDEACPWKEVIGKVIRRHKRELQFCYDRSLTRQQRGFSAALDVSFSIGPAGGLAAVELVSTSGVGDFDNCVQQRVSRWIFPETGLAIRANYPFRFDVM